MISSSIVRTGHVHMIQAGLFSWGIMAIQLGSYKIGARKLAVELALMVPWALMVHTGRSINVIDHINNLKGKKNLHPLRAEKDSIKIQNSFIINILD